MPNPWPDIDYFGTGAPSDLKSLTPAGLDHLMAKAADGPFSALGNPLWFKRNRERIGTIVLEAFGLEQPDAYRCIVTAFLDNGSGARFTLDVSTSDFVALPDITDEQLVTFAHHYLGQLPALKSGSG